MLLNSKSDIKKIFAIKIFTTITQNFFNKDFKEDKKENNLMKNYDNTLHISTKTIEKVIDLYYNFGTELQLNKGYRSNNPTGLLCEMIQDHSFYKLLLSVLLNHIETLNELVGKEIFSLIKKLILIYMELLCLK